MQETKLTIRAELPEKWSEFLGEQPETGMGFQDVELTLSDGQKINGIVINGRILETITSIDVDDISSMRTRR